jgi:hypothetical protein
MFAIGSALILIPVPAGAGAAAIVISLLVGVVAVAVGLAGTASEGRGTLPLSAQAGFDRALAVVLFVLAAGFGLAGDSAAAATFAGTGALAVGVTGATSYSASA